MPLVYKKLKNTIMVTKEFRTIVREHIVANRELYPDLSDAKYAKMIGTSSSVFSRLKSGETERIANDTFWIEQARKLNIQTKKRQLNFAETTVYHQIKGNIEFCKEYSKATIMVDNNGIGKTRCTKRVFSTMQNAFYIDVSQCKTKSEFIRTLAKTVGVENTGRLVDVKANTKYQLNLLDIPVVALDDAGYADTNVLIEVLEFWNATENNVGWLMIGDDSFEYKIQKGLNSKKLGYKALFSRFSSEFIRFSPTGVEDKIEFYEQLIGDVAAANVGNQSTINKMIKKCIAKEQTLRYLETLVFLQNN